MLEGATGVQASGVDLPLSLHHFDITPATMPERSPIDHWIFNTPRQWVLRSADAAGTPPGSGPLGTLTLGLIQAGPDSPIHTPIQGDRQGVALGTWEPKSKKVLFIPLRDMQAGLAILRQVASRMPPLTPGQTPSPWPGDEWRLRLLRGQQEMATPTQATDQPEALRVWSTSAEGAVASAIAVIASADRALAERTAERLLQTAQLPLQGGLSVRVPIWADQIALGTLLELVLTGNPTRREIIERVSGWLGTAGAPDGVVWTIDDAGGRDGNTDQPMGRLGVLTLGKSAVPKITPDDTQVLVKADLTALEKGQGQTLSISLRQDRPQPDPESMAQAAAEGVGMRVQLGDAELPANLALRPVPMRPPGVPIGPAMEDWTMAGFQLGVPTPRLGASGLAMVDPETGQVRLVFESPLAGPEDRQSVAIYLGTPGRSTLVATATSQGKLTSLPAGQATGRFALSAERWSVIVDLPADVIDPDGSVRVGWTIVDGTGRRASWPRPQLPWEVEPGRVVLDTRGWDQGLVRGGE